MSDVYRVSADGGTPSAVAAGPVRGGVLGGAGAGRRDDRDHGARAPVLAVVAQGTQPH